MPSVTAAFRQCLYEDFGTRFTDAAPRPAVPALATALPPPSSVAVLSRLCDDDEAGGARDTGDASEWTLFSLERDPGHIAWSEDAVLLRERLQSLRRSWEDLSESTGTKKKTAPANTASPTPPAPVPSHIAIPAPLLYAIFQRLTLHQRHIDAIDAGVCVFQRLRVLSLT